MRRIVFILLISLAMPSFANSLNRVVKVSPCVRGTQLNQHDLTEHYHQGIFNIYYTLQGDDAIKSTLPVSSTNTSEVIRDIATQLTSANQFYQQDLHLILPLKQTIYRQAQQINVFIINLNGMGRAFDRVAYETLKSGEKIPCGIKIMLSNHLNPLVNPTPAHELFHLYQYGYTMFKQRWYLEGMAHWLEQVFKPEQSVSINLTPPLNCNVWYQQNYQASLFWQSIANYYTHNAPTTVSVKKAKYSNQQPVFKQPVMEGGAFVQPMLNALAKLSIQVSLDNQRPNSQWSESQQHDPVDNAKLCDSINQLIK